jgi:hypothetical protein
VRNGFTIAAVVAVSLWASAAGANRAVSLAPAAAGAVNLENKRRVPLLDFRIVLPAGDRTPEIVVAKLEKPLGPGASASLTVTGVKGCRFQARWTFADFADAGDVDLCGGGRIILVD